MKKFWRVTTLSDLKAFYAHFGYRKTINAIKHIDGEYGESFEFFIEKHFGYSTSCNESYTYPIIMKQNDFEDWSSNSLNRFYNT